MMYKTILALDPSGSFLEGKGTTGWSFFNGDNLVPIAVGQIRAADHTSKYEYWDSHIKLIRTMNPEFIICEDYFLYADKANQQINSRMETPKLIGIMEYEANKLEIPFKLQPASIKDRWNEDILIYKGVISRSPAGRYYAAGVQISDHVRDSIKHGVHIIKFKNK